MKDTDTIKSVMATLSRYWQVLEKIGDLANYADESIQQGTAKALSDEYFYLRWELVEGLKPLITSMARMDLLRMLITDRDNPEQLYTFYSREVSGHRSIDLRLDRSTEVRLPCNVQTPKGS